MEVHGATEASGSLVLSWMPEQTNSEIHQFIRKGNISKDKLHDILVQCFPNDEIKKMVMILVHIKEIL